MHASLKSVALVLACLPLSATRSGMAAEQNHSRKNNGPPPQRVVLSPVVTKPPQTKSVNTNNNLPIHSPITPADPGHLRGPNSQSHVSPLHSPRPAIDLFQSPQLQNSLRGSGHPSIKGNNSPSHEGVASHGDPSMKGGKVIDPGFNTPKFPKHDPETAGQISNRPAGPLPPNVVDRGSNHTPKFDAGNKLHVVPPGKALADRLKHGELNRLVDAKLARQVDLKKQFELHQQGDLSRRLNLGNQLALRGGWRNRLCGPIDPFYFYCLTDLATF